MRSIWTIARNDLRLFLRDAGSYFWLFGSPLLFAFFMGFANKGPGSPANPRPPVVIENKDNEFLSTLLIEEIGKGLSVRTNTAEADRIIRIPEGFTRGVLEREPKKLELAVVQGSREEAASMVELKLFRAVLGMNAYLIEHSGSGEAPAEQPLRDLMRKAGPVGLDAVFGTRKPIPAGNQQSVPGVIVMFILMNLLIFGGVTIARERREGVLRRILVQPTSLREVLAGKILGLILLGAVQIVFLLLMAKWFMKVSFSGNLHLVLLTMAVYALTAAALGVLVGSLVAREDKVVALCVLTSMVMAAMGGCWWPLEIVPENVRLLGHVFPTAWAMDALHQLISFGGGAREILTPMGVLALFAAGAATLAVRFFRP